MNPSTHADTIGDLSDQIAAVDRVTHTKDRPSRRPDMLTERQPHPRHVISIWVVFS